MYEKYNHLRYRIIVASSLSAAVLAGSLLYGNLVEKKISESLALDPICPEAAFIRAARDIKRARLLSLPGDEAELAPLANRIRHDWAIVNSFDSALPAESLRHEDWEDSREIIGLMAARAVLAVEKGDMAGVKAILEAMIAPLYMITGQDPADPRLTAFIGMHRLSRQLAQTDQAGARPLLPAVKLFLLDIKSHEMPQTLSHVMPRLEEAVKTLDSSMPGPDFESAKKSLTSLSEELYFGL